MRGFVPSLGSEDCLYLNVFSKMKWTSRSKLPVMVCLHGGGFEVGNAIQFCGEEILMQYNVVYVSLQYRLNIFGFLSTEDQILPGNMGLKDQNLALEWIQDNIHLFGGDKKSVTIMGISAGGASVHYHILSPKSIGLFHRALKSSGTAINPWSLGYNHRSMAEEFAKSVNCPLNQDSKEFLNCIQDLKTEDVYRFHGYQPVSRVDNHLK